MPADSPACWFDAPRRPKSPDEEIHRLVFPHVKGICIDQEEVWLQNKLNSQLYSNHEPMLFDWFGELTIDASPINSNLENILQSTVDTLESVVAKYQYKATPTPRGAAFSTYLRARQLDRYLYATFLEQNVYNLFPRIFVDGLVFGTGVLKVGTQDGELFTERVHIHEIVVDQRQCVSCSMPRELFQLKLVTKLFLINKFAKRNTELRQKIMEATPYGFQGSSGRSSVEDYTVVIEGWHLDAKRRVLCIDTATLEDDDYTDDEFPFIFFRPKEPISGGFYGHSLVEDLTGYQIRLDEMNDKIRVGHDLMIVPRIFLDVGQEVMGTQIDNELGKIIRGRFNGNPPTPLTWNAFNPEIYNERDRMGSKALNFAGVTEMSAQGKLPAGTRLDSGEAINQYAAREDSRFARLAQKYEALTPELARHYVRLLAKLGTNAKRHRKFYRTKYMAKGIDWDKAWEDFDSYQLTVEVASLTQMTPAGRTQVLDEWAAKGKVNQDEYRAWSGLPDLEHSTDLLSAANDHIEYTIEQMLDGKAQQPDPYDNLARAFRLVTDTYLHIRCLEPDEGNTKTHQTALQLMRNYLQLAKNLVQPPNQPVQPNPGGITQPTPGLSPGMVDPATIGPMGGGEYGMPGGQTMGAPKPGISFPAAQGIAL